jgi:PAS domain S-box-containing protein
MRRPIARQVGGGLTLAVLIAGAIGYFAYRTSEQLRDGAVGVKHAYQILVALDHLRLELGQARTAARSYAIVGDVSQLQNYRGAVVALDSVRDSLRLLTDDNPVQRLRFERLTGAVGTLVRGWDSLLAKGPGRPADMALAYGRNPPNYLLQARVDGLLAELEKYELGTLQDRESENRALAGRSRWLLSSAVGLTFAILVGTWVMFIRYLWARDAAEAERTRLQGFLDSIVENIPLMVFVKDATELRFVRFNRAGEELLGLSRDALLGRNDYDLFPKEQADFFTGKDQETLASGHEVTIEEEPIQTQHHGSRLLRTRKMAVRDADGRPAYLLGISEDITERKLAEDRMRHLNEALVQRSAELQGVNAELESFSYSVSHDLRAPLRAIEGFSRILQEEHARALDAEGLRLFDVVRTNARRMAQLIDDLLHFSRVGRQGLTREVVNVTAVVEGQLADLRQSDPARRVVVTVDPLPAALGDPAMVSQITANLLSNAWKFTRGREAAVISVQGRRTDREVEYVFTDNGAGFDMKYADKLFGVFQRLHRQEEFEGTGVGLAVVYRIVQRHGGRIWADSAPGRGATFHFTLPAAENGA